MQVDMGISFHEGGHMDQTIIPESIVTYTFNI